MSVARAIGELEKKLGTRDVELSNPMQKLAVEEKDQDKRRKDAEKALQERLDNEPECKTEHLARYICSSWEHAKTARTAACIDEEITEGRRLIRGEYTYAEKKKMREQEDGIDTWYHLTRSIHNTALAFFRSVLTPDADNPVWSLRDNKLPNLPEDLVEREAEFLVSDIEEEIQLTPPVFDELGNQVPVYTPEQFQERLDELRENLFDKVDALSERQTRNLERKTADVLEIGDFYEVLDDFLEDLTCDPYACIYGPIISTKKQPEWKNNRKVWVERQYLHYEAIDVDRVWPSEDASNPQDGSWMFYLDQHTKSYLTKAKKMRGFVPENIDILLKTFANSCRSWTNPMEAEMERLEDRVYPSWRNEERVDVLKAFGEIPGEELLRSGIEKYCGKKIKATDCYEYEVWLVDKHIIRAIPRVFEGARPFFCASMYPTCGSFYGKSLPMLIEDAQRKANFYDRSEVLDVAYAAAPIFETDVALLDIQSGKVPNKIRPGLNIKKNSKLNPRGGRVLEHTRIESQAQYLNQLKQQTFAEAELITGINRQMMGQAQPGVSTLGESQLLQQNAATQMRSMLHNIDKNVLEPIIEMTTCLIMETTDDPTLMADVRIQARGSTDLLTRELNKNSLLQLLQIIQGDQTSVFEPQALKKLYREIIRSFGQDPDDYISDPLSAIDRQLERQRLALESQALAQGAAGGAAGNPAQVSNVQSPAAGQSPASIGNAAIS